MIELTLEQRRAISCQGQEPPRAFDPDTQTTYVLIREDLYERLKSLLTEDDQFVHGLYPHVMQVFGRDGWDDPAMEIYNDLDPRRQP